MLIFKIILIVVVLIFFYYVKFLIFFFCEYVVGISIFYCVLKKMSINVFKLVCVFEFNLRDVMRYKYFINK